MFKCQYINWPLSQPLQPACHCAMKHDGVKTDDGGLGGIYSVSVSYIVTEDVPSELLSNKNEATTAELLQEQSNKSWIETTKLRLQ